MASDVQEGVLGNKFLWLLGGAGGTYCYYKGKQSAKKDFEVRENAFKVLEDAFKSREGILEARKGALQDELNHCQARKDALRGELSQYKDQVADFTNRTLGLFRFMPHELVKQFILQHPGADAEIGQTLSTTTSADEACNICVEWLLKHPEFHQHAISEILHGYEELQVEYKNFRRCYTGPYTENFRPWILKKFVPRSDIDALQNLMAIIVKNPEKLQLHIAIVIKIIDKGLHHYVDASPGSKACFKELQVLLTVWFMTLHRDGARIKELETTLNTTERQRKTAVDCLEKIEKFLTDMTAQLKAANTRVTALAADKAELVTRIRSGNMDIFHRTSELQAEKKVTGELRSEKKQLEQSLATEKELARSNLKDKDEALDKVQNELNGLLNEKGQLEQKFTAEMKKYATTSSSLTNKTQELIKAQTDLSGLRVEKGQLEQKLTAEKKQHANAISNLNITKAALDETQRSLKDVQTESERTDAKITKLKGERKVVEKERDSARRAQAAQRKVFKKTQLANDTKIGHLKGNLKAARKQNTSARRAQRDSFDLQIRKKDTELRRQAENSKEKDIDNIKLARSVRLCIAIQTFLLSKSNQRVQDLETETAAVRSQFSSVLYVQNQKSKSDKQNTEKLEARLATIEQEKEDLTAANARISADLSNKTAELVTAGGKISTLQTSNSDLQTQLDESNNARDRIQSDLDTANSRLTTLQSEKENADAEVTALKEKLISTKNDSTALQSAKDKADAEVTTLKKQLTNAEEQASRAKKDIQRLEQVEKDKDQELTELRGSEEESKAKTLRLENDLKTTTEQLKQSAEDLETKSSSLTMAQDEARREREAAEAVRAELDNAIRTHKKEKEDDETALKVLKDSDNDLTKYCADKDDALEEAEEDARQAREAAEATRAELIRDHQKEMASLKTANRILQAKCDATEDTIHKERRFSARQEEINRRLAPLIHKLPSVLKEARMSLERVVGKSEAVTRSADVSTQHLTAAGRTLQVSDVESQRDPAILLGSSGSALHEDAEGPASTSSSPGKVKQIVSFLNRTHVAQQQSARDGQDLTQGFKQQRAAHEDLNVAPGTSLCRCSNFVLCEHGHRTWSKLDGKAQCTLCHRTYELRELDEVLFSVQCETCREKFTTEWEWKEHSETSGHTEHTTVLDEIIPREDEVLENEESITINAKLVEEQLDGLKDLDEEDREAALQALGSFEEATESRTTDPIRSNQHGNSHYDAEELQPQGDGSQGRDGSEIDYEHFTSALSDDELSDDFDGDGDNDHDSDSDKDEDDTGDEDHADNAASPIVDPHTVDATPSPSRSPPTGLAGSAFATPPNVAHTTPPSSPCPPALSPAFAVLDFHQEALCFPCGASFEDAKDRDAHIKHLRNCEAPECATSWKEKKTICHECKKVKAFGKMMKAHVGRHKAAEGKARKKAAKTEYRLQVSTSQPPALIPAEHQAPRRTDREPGTETANAWHVFDRIDLSNLDEMDFDPEETPKKQRGPEELVEDGSKRSAAATSATPTTDQCSGPARAEGAEEAVLSSPTQGLPSATLGTNESFEQAQPDANHDLEDGQQGSLNAMMQAFARHFGLPLEELSGILSQIAEGLNMTLEEVETWMQDSTVTHEEVFESVLLALVQTSPVSGTTQEAVAASRESDTQLMAPDNDAEGPANIASPAEDMGQHYIMEDPALLDVLEEQGELQVFPHTTQDDLSPALLSRRRASTTGSLSFPLAGPRDDLRADAILCPHRDSIWGCNRASCERIHQCARCEAIGLCLDHDI